MKSWFAFVALAFVCAISRLHAAEPAATTLRILCYNIHHAEGLDGKVDTDRIAQLIVDQKADIVGLQEVDKGVQRTQGRDIAAELAQKTGLTAWFDRNIDHQGGEYGNAILTRFPILTRTNTHYKMLRPGEQRGLQQAVLDVRGQKIAFLNTHLDYRPDDSERKLNVGEIRAAIGGLGGLPAIVVGDFNCQPDSEVQGALREFLTDSWLVAGKGEGFTIPVRQPRSRIDYIFHTPAARFRVDSIQVLESEASDHLPVLAVLTLLPAAE